MKQTISILTLLILLFAVSCQKEGVDDAEPTKPQDEYTKENPGEWAPVAKDHIPQVELKGKLDPNNIHVTLSGTEFNSSHYIEKVGLVDKEKKELVSKSLEKGLHEASLTYKYDFDDLKDMKVYVKCNLHDVWTLTLDKAEIKR